MIILFSLNESSSKFMASWEKDPHFVLLSRGEEGVTVQIDSDGEFEWTGTSGSEFTSDDITPPMIIYPNPCYPNQEQIVTIVNLPFISDVKIYIYDLGGNLIRTLGESETNIQGGTKTATWDCRNDNGEVVTRGIYIYFIPSPSEKKTGKIAIIK